MIRKANAADTPIIRDIIDKAKAFMRKNDNPYQWDEADYPGNKVPGDIEKGNGYVVERNGKVCGYFAFILGKDPTYTHIEGEWLDDVKDYGTIHRVASDGTEHEVLEEVLEYAFSVIDNIRIDTHEANGPMRHKLEKNGFTYCGIIYVEDGTPRRAYQKEKSRL